MEDFCASCRIVYSDEKNNCKNCKKYSECVAGHCLKEDNSKCFVEKVWNTDDVKEVRY